MVRGSCSVPATIRRLLEAGGGGGGGGEGVLEGEWVLQSKVRFPNQNPSLLDSIRISPLPDLILEMLRSTIRLPT